MACGIALAPARLRSMSIWSTTTLHPAMRGVLSLLLLLDLDGNKQHLTPSLSSPLTQRGPNTTAVYATQELNYCFLFVGAGSDAMLLFTSAVLSFNCACLLHLTTSIIPFHTTALSHWLFLLSFLHEQMIETMSSS
jgi:hypothetical protein